MSVFLLLLNASHRYPQTFPNLFGEHPKSPRLTRFDLDLHPVITHICRIFGLHDFLSLEHVRFGSEQEEELSMERIYRTHRLDRQDYEGEETFFASPLELFGQSFEGNVELEES